MADAPLPKVSFVIPVLNAAGMLDNCLQSISRQTYPRDRYEVILADGGSTDGTQKIGRAHGAVMIDDQVSRNMEESKRVALGRATGEYVVFIDADNEITHLDYMERAIAALRDRPQALGVEAYYLPSAKMTSLCVYLTHLLHISDPLCWLMSANPVHVSTSGEVETWTLPAGTESYPLGANGFVYRKADLDAVKAGQKFQDTHVALFLMRSGKREWLRIAGRGVHHYYVDTLMNFMRKRRRATVHFLNVRREFGNMWLEQKPPVPGWLACVYCVSILGPAWHVASGWLRSGDPRWLWHFPASLASVTGAVWGFLTHRLRSRDEKLVAKLQPRQRLKYRSLGKKL
jgi:glycosyltransferase involved in cell wall biosynthesis